jgi:hypothetical protein
MQLHRLPGWLPISGTTLLTKNHVWLQDQMPAWVLEHEKVHLDQVQYGGWHFRLGYLFKSKVRLQAEAEAYAVSVALGDDLEECAENLSGWLYGWVCTKEEARDLIKSYQALLPVDGRIIWEPHKDPTPYPSTPA